MLVAARRHEGAFDRAERMALAAHQFRPRLGDMAPLARRDRYVVYHCTSPMIDRGCRRSTRMIRARHGGTARDFASNPAPPTTAAIRFGLSLRPAYGCDRSFPPTNNTVVASARQNTAPRLIHTGNGAHRAVIYVDAADAVSGLIAVYGGQCTAQWKAFYCRCNRFLCTPRCDDYSVERRVVRVDLRIVGPGIRMRKYRVNRIVTKAELVRCIGIDGLASTEWRLRGLIHYFRI